MAEPPRLPSCAGAPSSPCMGYTWTPNPSVKPSSAAQWCAHLPLMALPLPSSFFDSLSTPRQSPHAAMRPPLPPFPSSLLPQSDELFRALHDLVLLRLMRGGLEAEGDTAVQTRQQQQQHPASSLWVQLQQEDGIPCTTTVEGGACVAIWSETGGDRWIRITTVKDGIPCATTTEGRECQAIWSETGRVVAYRDWWIRIWIRIW